MGFSQPIRRATLRRCKRVRGIERIYSGLRTASDLRPRKACMSTEPISPNLPDYGLRTRLNDQYDLCLFGCSHWATIFAPQKRAVKLHTPARSARIDSQLHPYLRRQAPRRQCSGLVDFPEEAGSFYVMDRAYLDYARLFNLAQAGAFFSYSGPNQTWTSGGSIQAPTDRQALG